MKPFMMQFKNQALGFVREPAAAVFNILVPFIIVLTQAVAFGAEEIGSSLPGYRVVDALAVNAGVMFTMIIGLFGMGVGLSSMIEARTIAGASLRPYGADLVLRAYALALLLMVLLGWLAAYLVLRIGWEARLPSHPFAAVLVMALSVAMFLMIGACVAVMVGTPRSAQGVCSVVFFPLLFLSGVVFPIDVFPAPL
ncbi:ABC transporter permease, partial [Canibacter sp. lx-72]|uniref:ABC transporter permease n=1 Tax=Canibacter zhuwentaonis TaxID=2837491 RepID=UPI001BDDBB12